MRNGPQVADGKESTRPDRKRAHARRLGGCHAYGRPNLFIAIAVITETGWNGVHACGEGARGGGSMFYWRMGTANRVASVLVVLYTILWVRRSRCRGPSCQLGMRARRCVANEGVDVLRLSEAGGADGMPCGGLVNLLLPWCRECPRSHGRGQLSHHAHACVGALSHADVVAGAGAGALATAVSVCAGVSMHVACGES